MASHAKEGQIGIQRLLSFILILRDFLDRRHMDRRDRWEWKFTFIDYCMLLKIFAKYEDVLFSKL